MSLVRLKSIIVLVWERSKELKADKNNIYWINVVKAANGRPERSQVF